MDIDQKRQIFEGMLRKSKMFGLIGEQEKGQLLNTIATATENQLNLMVIKFDEDEKKLVAMDKEIADAETKKTQLEEQKKKFLAELEVNVKKDAEESAKRAEEILNELKEV